MKQIAKLVAAGVFAISAIPAQSAALVQEESRLPAILTFVATASGITIFGIGAPFWGLVGGIVLLLLLRQTQPK